MAENEGQKKTKSTNNIQNLIFVPQGCSYFLDTTDSKRKDQRQYTGLITQSCGPCACIIVRNRDNTKMVLAHVDSGNDITDEEFGLPKWVRQCGNGNNVIVEVYMGCAYNPNIDRERIIKDINDIRTDLGLSEEQVKINEDKNSQGGMILRRGYRLDFEIKSPEIINAQLKFRSNKEEKYKEIITEIEKLEADSNLSNLDRLARIFVIEQQTNTRLINSNTIQIINDDTINIPTELQLSFDEGLTDKIYKKIEKQILEDIKKITNKSKNNITCYIEDTSKPSNNAKADSAFCQKHNIKVPLIPLDEIDKFENGLTEEFKKRIDNQPYIKSCIEEQKKEELQKQQEQEKELKQQEQLKEEELRQEEQQPEQLEEENHININNRQQELIEGGGERKSKDAHAERQHEWQNYIKERQKLSEETAKIGLKTKNNHNTNLGRQ